MDLSLSVADDVRLNVRHQPGDKADQPFLLVHGLGSNARLWDEVSQLLAARGHPTYAVDLRGHGESDAPESGYSTATAAADVAAVAAGLGLRSAVVVGHSWGGNVVVRLAAEHPALVRGLALVDGGWITLSESGSSWDDFAARWATTDLTGVSAENMRAFLRLLHPGWSATAIEATMADLCEEPDGTVSRRLSGPRQMAILRDMWDEPPAQWYPAITAPVMLLPAIPNQRRVAKVRPWVAAAAAALPAAIVREYLESDHDLHAQHPDRVAADLLDLARLVEPPVVARP